MLRCTMTVASIKQPKDYSIRGYSGSGRSSFISTDALSFPD
jgi:hypothetical protein